MKLKRIKLGPIIIIKRKSLNKFIKRIELALKIKEERIYKGFEFLTDTLKIYEDLIKSVEKGIIKSMQEQGF